MKVKKNLYMACVSDAWCTTESCVPLSKQAYFDKERAILEAFEDARKHERPLSDYEVSLLREQGQTQCREENYIIETICLVYES